MKAELEKLYDHIDDIEIAMMTTRRPDGHLQSRAMATQKRAEGADLWFVTLEGAQKLRDIAAIRTSTCRTDKDRNREWVSVSGLASITRDRHRSTELYAADWKAWFPDEGDRRHGTADDPRMVLIGVDVHAASFLEINKPQPIVLYEVVKGFLTGAAPQVGEMHHIEK